MDRKKNYSTFFLSLGDMEVKLHINYIKGKSKHGIMKNNDRAIYVLAIRWYLFMETFPEPFSQWELSGNMEIIGMQSVRWTSYIV